VASLDRPNSGDGGVTVRAGLDYWGTVAHCEPCYQDIVEGMRGMRGSWSLYPALCATGGLTFTVLSRHASFSVVQQAGFELTNTALSGFGWISSLGPRSLYCQRGACLVW